MSKDITPAQAKKAGEELAQVARKAPSPALAPAVGGLTSE